MIALVVDDETAIVQLVAEILGDDGWDVVTAFDGRAALALLQQGLQPRIVVSDIMMPRLDGIGLYTAIRNDLLLTVGIVLMSAGRTPPRLPSDEHAIFLSKPFDVDALMQAVDLLTHA